MTGSQETKEIINQAILDYLHRSGFSKTHKRFISEAQIQNDTLKASSTTLEDIYYKYLSACGQTEDNVVVESETQTKKKKSKDEIEDVKLEAPKKPIDEAVNALEVTESKKKSKDKKREINQEDKPKVCRGQTEDNVVVEETKTEKKKKSKNETEEVKLEAPKKPIDEAVNGLEVTESKKKSKDKKRKSNQEDQQEVCNKENGDVDQDVDKEEKKSSKKRKRSISNDNDDQSTKIETNTTIKEVEVAEIDKLENKKAEINEVEKSGPWKSEKKQRVGSAEPKTVTAFQRVKIDEVEFAHEKLQDNSYWAKDGADVGYGAKAQEVLGQVRGRDFRHEKTKKKRGSYRGGQIDLQSHSIKFDYSEEE
uniref:nucleolar and coiled-body phosphoprotein 1 n=1 Tax=Erigeron canadensis TaxID=72917 RepID=UPI001CB8EAA0|nr:nucleolar and coiled-body phosphoprotein 1 [Erigeron canadensis]